MGQVTDTLTELKRLHAAYEGGEVVGFRTRFRSPDNQDQKLVNASGEELAMTFNEDTARYVAAAVNALPKLLACVEVLQGLHDDTVEYVTLNKLHDADGSPAINNHWMKQARAALASLKGVA